MRKRICLLLGVCLWSLAGFAQNEPCKEKLKLANRAYDEGRVNDVPKLLKGCIEQLDRERKKEVYRLLTLTYMYLDDGVNAPKYMQKYLRLTKKLTRAELMGEGISEFDELYHKYNTDPVFWYGMSLGANYSKAKATKVYLPVNSTNPGKYVPATGALSGLIFGLPLSHSFWLGIEVNYSLQQFSHNSTNALTEVNFAEKRRLLTMPLYARVLLRNRWKKFRPFVSVGLWGNYLLSSRGHLKHANVGINPGTQQTQPLDITSLRARRGAGALLGAGVLLEVKKAGVFVLDFRYKPGFTNIIKPGQRLEQLGYKDDDMWVNSFSVSLGFYLPVYNVRLKRKYR